MEVRINFTILFFSIGYLLEQEEDKYGRDNDAAITFGT